MSNRWLTALAIAPNVVYVIGLFTLAAWRMASGLQPLPNGSTAFVMAMSTVIPVASVALVTVLRLRRDAKRPTDLPSCP